MATFIFCFFSMIYSLGGWEGLMIISSLNFQCYNMTILNNPEKKFYLQLSQSFSILKNNMNSLNFPCGHKDFISFYVLQCPTRFFPVKFSLIAYLWRKLCCHPAFLFQCHWLSYVVNEFEVSIPYHKYNLMNIILLFYRSFNLIYCIITIAHLL